MFRDTKKELQRLEAELLAEEEWEEESEEMDEEWEEPVYRNFSNHYGANFRAYNSDESDTDLEMLSETVYQPRRRSLLPLLLLLLLIAAVLLCWVVWEKEMLPWSL